MDTIAVRAIIGTDWRATKRVEFWVDWPADRYIAVWAPMVFASPGCRPASGKVIDKVGPLSDGSMVVKMVIGEGEDFSDLVTRLKALPQLRGLQVIGA